MTASFDPGQRTLRDHLGRYCLWLGVNKFAETTVKTKRFTIEWFIEWCEEREVHRPTEVDAALLERYKRFLHYHRKRDGEPLSAATQASRIDVIRAYFHWLVKERVVPCNPAEDVETPRPERRLPASVLNEPEAETILAMPDIERPAGLRDRTTLELFFCTGMRRAELRNLRVHDIDFERGVIAIRQGKGRKDRFVPLSERGAAWLRKYLEQGRPHLVREPDTGYLLLTRYGRPWHLDALTLMGRKYVRKAGIKKPGACHLWRHTCATLLLDNGAGLRDIQDLLGHSQLETVKIYTHVSITGLKAMHARCHPAAKVRPTSR